ncbi:MAG TPA: MFS transporter [Xanthobacteraceae bacterium]|jgi:predicted MFS family arabinose efflux permease|nr:MFS transporter [Xanthobacteraceae bacterium]
MTEVSPPKPSVRRVLAAVSIIAFATALFSRAVDPIIPQIAKDLMVTPETVALLSTGFALPFALVQPVLGPFADIIGKPRVMIACLIILIIAAFVGSITTSFPLLLMTRIVAGMATGGVFPVALALVGDLVPVAERQVALGRYLAMVITGNLMGLSLAGFVGDLIGWRGVFVVAGLCGITAFIAALAGFRGAQHLSQAKTFSLATMLSGYRTVFANPRAKVCYAAVFLEGLAVFGLFPYVALLMHLRGEERASIAGLVLAGFAIGGIGYSFIVPMMLRRFTLGTIMIMGGGIAAISLAGFALIVPWPVTLGIFALFGFGFYTLHGSIQVQATELAPDARGAAVALHAFFFFVGQGTGPVLYGFGFANMDAAFTLAFGAAIILFVGFFCSRLLGPAKAE